MWIGAFSSWNNRVTCNENASPEDTSLCIYYNKTQAFKSEAGIVDGHSFIEITILTSNILSKCKVDLKLNATH